MHQRGVGFTTSLIVVAILTTVPSLYLAEVLAQSICFGGGGIGGFAGMDRSTQFQSVLNTVSMVNDRFHRASLHCSVTTNRATISIESINPEDGRGSDRENLTATWQEYEVPGYPTAMEGYYCFVVGDAKRLWVIDTSDVVYELDDSRMIQRSRKPADTPGRPIWAERGAFAMNGHLTTVVTNKSSAFELFHLVDDRWLSLGEVKMLDTARDWQSASHQSLLFHEPQTVAGQPSGTPNLAKGITSRRAGLPATGTIEVLTIGSTVHLFWRLSDRLLHRSGFDLIPANSYQSLDDVKESSTNDAVSALEPENADGVTHDWTLVAENMSNDAQWFRVAVGGEPAVILIDKSRPQYPRAKALRMEGTHWAEFAVMELPFASHAVGTGSRDDGSAGYLATATILGRARVLAIEPTGFRLTPLDDAPWVEAFAGYIFIGFFLAWNLFMALILATATTLLMCRDQARFEFGRQTVELASVWERGTSRIIDFSLIVMLTGGVFFALNFALEPDWKTFIEAVHQFGHESTRVLDHPSVTAPSQIAAACLSTLFISILTLITAQGAFGRTPGKWICGLRTMRTTLRPCGFARSLLREVLLCIESLYFITWTPGILCIAFSECRQRFGDILADTIVVRAGSLAIPTQG